VAEFFTYLSSPKVQADWHQFTGYLPITKQAYKLTQQQGFYKMHPGTETAVIQMTSTKPTVNSKGIRFGNFLQTRDIINEELESVWSGDQSAQAALNNAVRLGNEQLRRFERTK
jgi:sn-glycerol 3-phosphate transport system substrate-binding protein